MSNSTLSRALLLSLGLCGASLSFNAHAQPETLAASDFGAAVSEQSADRVIMLTAATKSVNVTNGETVRFIADGKSFTWHFNGYDGRNCELGTIAPPALGFSNVQVYVASNPLYTG